MVMSKLLLGLFIIVFASACSPAPTASPSVEVMLPTLQQATVEPTGTQSPVASTPAPTEAILAAPTSRGSTLEATDPASVSLASGGLQLVEFFRFT